MTATERFDHIETRPVQILHHEFDASPELDDSVRSLLNMDYADKLRLHFFGTRQAAVLPPEVSVGMYDPGYEKFKKDQAVQAAKIKQAQVEFARASVSIHLERVKFRRLDNYLRIMAKPCQQLVFNKVLSGLALIPDALQQAPRKGVGHYVYVDIPHAAVIQDPDEWKEAVDAFDPTQRFSMLTPLSIEAFDREARLGPESYAAVKKVS